MKIFRPKGDPDGVVIDFEDGSPPAFIPICADYAFKAIKKLAKEYNRKDEGCRPIKTKKSKPNT